MMPPDVLTSSIAAWLKVRRNDFAARATQLGLPLAVSEQVPIATFTDGGMQSTAETRPRSLISSFGPVAPPTIHNPALYARITDPFIDAAGEGIAKSLVEAYGDRVKFACTFGPLIVQRELEHPELITKLSSHDDPSDIEAHMLGWEPIFYGLLVVRQCLMEYVSSLPSLGIENEALAQRLASEAVSFAGGRGVTSVGRVLVSGLEIDGLAMDIGDVTLRRLSPEELGYLFWRRHSIGWQPSRVGSNLPSPIHPDMWLQERIALEVRTTRPKTDIFFSVATRCQKLLLAMHLVGLEFSGSGFGAMLQEPRWMFSSSGQSFQPLLMPKGPRHTIAKLSVDDLGEVTALAELIPDGAVSAPTSPMELALRRLSLAMSRPEPTDAIVDYAVALEALFLGGTDTGEAKRRFALNGAIYCGTSALERRRIYDELSDIYGARSVMVHGVNPQERRARRVLGNVAKITDQAREIARLALRKATITGWPDDATFINLLLDHAAETVGPPAAEGGP